MFADGGHGVEVAQGDVVAHSYAGEFQTVCCGFSQEMCIAAM